MSCPAAQHLQQLNFLEIPDVSPSIYYGVIFVGRRRTFLSSRDLTGFCQDTVPCIEGSGAVPKVGADARIVMNTNR